MLLLIICGLICISFSFSIGVLAGRKPKQLIQGTIPIANIIQDFEEFVCSLEGGHLSVDADAAIKVLKAHAERKYLPASNRQKKDTWQGKREDNWSDLRCFEKEMEKAENDDERISVIRHWLVEYRFLQPWQTWCFQQMVGEKARSLLRIMFEEDKL